MIRRLVERSLRALTGARHRFSRGAAALHHDEEGASLVFAAITLFSLALTSFMVFQVGMVSSERLQIQNAADAAAYSAAVVEANSLDAIGQLNDSMSYVHYTLLRYTIDQVVYGTLAQFRTHHTAARRENGSLFSQPTMIAVPPFGRASPADPSESGGSIENQPGPTFVPLGDANDWNERIGRVKRLGGLDGQETAGLQKNGESMIEQAAKWELDLHTAARIILNTTPRLCRQVALEVADKNGATHLAFSSDLEKAWKTSGEGAGFAQNDGGTDPVEGTASEQLYLRYQKLRTLAVDQGERYDYPSWFEEAKGKSGSGYSSVRLCWNVNDWAHGQGRSFHLDFPEFMMGAPAGHWHCAHKHSYIDMSTYTVMSEDHGGISPRGQEKMTNGGGKGGGHQMPDDDDPILHQKAMEGFIDPFLPYDPHHAEITCPTCAARKYDSQSMWSEVKKTQQDVETYAPGSKGGLELKFQGGFPKPLVLRDVALQSGITVAAWRESTGIGELLPGSEWGTVAVASAQVGLLDGEGKVRALSELTQEKAKFGDLELQLKNDDKFRNLCYSIDPEKGVRFGARLVPIARKLTHHPQLESGGEEGAVAELLGGGTRWWVTSTADAQTGSAAPGPMAKLKDWVKVDSPEALKEALWH